MKFCIFRILNYKENNISTKAFFPNVSGFKDKQTRILPKKSKNIRRYDIKDLLPSSTLARSQEFSLKKSIMS